MKFEIDPDVRRAHTLPGEAYHSPEVFALARERVFARSWQCVLGAEALGDAEGSVAPFVLLPGCVDEPLVLTRSAGEVRCLSNVCTHRASLVVHEPGCAGTLRCRYHGRRFGLDGRLHHAPEFEGVEGFPSPSDDLPRCALDRLGPLWFTALAPAVPFAEWTAPVRERLAAAGLSLENLVFDPGASRDYEVAANWALYCDNYLEGLHIPFVHGSLAAALDYGAYRTETLPRGVLQVGIAREGEVAFAPPAGRDQSGERVAALYFWLFPNVMLNFYPWGLSLNVVQPLAVDRTRVAFRAYVWDASQRGRGAGSGLDRVELEDEAVVESVQRGVRSRLYRAGRYAATRETGVHHFHRLLAAALAG